MLNGWGPSEIDLYTLEDGSFEAVERYWHDNSATKVYLNSNGEIIETIEIPVEEPVVVQEDNNCEPVIEYYSNGNKKSEKYYCGYNPDALHRTDGPANIWYNDGTGSISSKSYYI